METPPIPPEYVEFVALLYHEGRNVSRLFRHNAASKKTFAELAGLPPDEAQAWDRLITLQQKAATTLSATTAEEVFKETFGCSVADLASLFGSDGWHRVPNLGGARWAAIAKSVGALGDAIDNKDEAAAAKLIEEIRLMHHNTGTVKDKLAKLKAKRR
jgi:hypothetical protein